MPFVLSMVGSSPNLLDIGLSCQADAPQTCAY
jgi:hypothetical protein